MKSIFVLLPTQGLSADCAKPKKGRKGPMSKMDIEPTLERLKAFAGLSSLQLSGTQAVVTVVRGDLKLDVKNERGRLMVKDAHSDDATGEEKPPEEIAGMLMAASASGDAKRSPKGTENPEGGIRAVIAAEGEKLVLIAAMLIATAIIGWINFGPESPPDGVQFIDQPVRVAGLNREFEGKYGDLAEISQVVFEVGESKLKVHLILPGGMDNEPLRVMDYRYGSLGVDEIMVAENGAVLTRDAYDNIVHAGSIYPRLP